MKSAQPPIHRCWDKIRSAKRRAWDGHSSSSSCCAKGIYTLGPRKAWARSLAAVYSENHRFSDQRPQTNTPPRSPDTVLAIISLRQRATLNSICASIWRMCRVLIPAWRVPVSPTVHCRRIVLSAAQRVVGSLAITREAKHASDSKPTMTSRRSST